MFSKRLKLFIYNVNMNVLYRYKRYNLDTFLRYIVSMVGNCYIQWEVHCMRNIFQKRSHKIMLAALVAFSMLLCCSCENKKKDVEYFGTEAKGASGGDASDNGHAISSAPIAEQLGASDKWVERVKSSNSAAGYMDVHAIVDAPDINIVNVAEAKIKSYNEEEQKEVLKALGMGNAILDESEDEDYKIFDYTSKQDGRIYCATFNGNNFSYSLANISEMLEIEEGYCFANLVTSSSSGTDYNISENKCELTEEEVENIAYDFTKKLGLRDFEIVKICAKEWQIAKQVDSEEEALSAYTVDDEWVYLGESKSIYDGAEVMLFRRIDGMHLTPMEIDAVKTVYDEETDTYVGVTAEGAPLCETLSLTITEDGVVCAYYNNAIEAVEITDRNVELASYDDICASLREALEKYETSMPIGSFTEMKLVYYGVEPKDDNGTCTIVPAWLLMATSDCWIAVDARDGSQLCISGW